MTDPRPTGADHRYPGGADGDRGACAPAGAPVMFVQSAAAAPAARRCASPTASSSIGDGDVLLGEVDGCPFYIDRRLDQAWGCDRFVLDVRPGAPEGFSLGAGDGLHFVTVPADAGARPTPQPID